MENKNCKTLFWNDLRWVLSPGIAPSILPSLWRVLDQPNREVIKANKHRTVYRLSLGDQVFYLKEYHRPSLIKTIAPLLGLGSSKGRYEWRIMNYLRRKNFPTARALGFGEKWKGGRLVQMYFLSLGLPGESLAHFLQRDFQMGPVAEMAHLISMLHSLWLYHPDCHLENFLIAPPAPQLFLLDFHSLRYIPFLPSWFRKKTLIKLCHSLVLGGWEKMVSPLLNHYYPLDPSISAGLPGLENSIFQGILNMEKTRLVSRTKRVLKNTTSFAVASTPLGKLFWDRRHDRQTMEKVIQLARETFQVGENKGRIRLENRDFWVEIFPPTLGQGKSSPGLCTWVGHRSAWLHSLSSPTAFAYLQSSSREVVVMEWIDGLERLDKRVGKDQITQDGIQSLARLIFSLHNSPLVYSDFSLGQIGFQSGSQRAFLLNLSRIRTGNFSREEIQDHLVGLENLLGEKMEDFFRKYNELLSQKGPLGHHPGQTHKNRKSV